MAVRDTPSRCFAFWGSWACTDSILHDSFICRSPLYKRDAFTTRVYKDVDHPFTQALESVSRNSNAKTTLVYSLSEATKPSTSHHHQARAFVSNHLRNCISCNFLPPTLLHYDKSNLLLPSLTLPFPPSSHGELSKKQDWERERDDRQAPGPRTRRQARIKTKKRHGTYGISGVNVLCCAVFRDSKTRLANLLSLEREKS